MTHAFTHGFTYIELILVMALIGIISSFTLAINLGGISQSSIISERNQLVALILYKNRSEALANVLEASHGVHIDNINKKYDIFTGNTYEESSPNNISIPFSNHKISVTTNPPVDIIFQPISADVIASTTISINNGTTEALISINNFGQIDW